MAAQDARLDRRVATLETDFALQRQQLGVVQEDVGGVARDLKSFREDWTKKAEEDRVAHRSARLTMPQIFSMIGTCVVVTGAMLGGIMYLISNQVGAVRTDVASQVAQVGLTVRGQVDSLTATQQALQAQQRELAEVKVSLGLVQQLSSLDHDVLKSFYHYDESIGRLDERLRAGEAEMRRLAIDRRPPS